jgi:hypothetical protein
MINSGVLAASLRPKRVKTPDGYQAGSNGSWPSVAWLLIDGLRPLVFGGYLIAFLIGVAAAIAFSNPVNQQPLNAILIDTLRGRINRLTADQEQMAREINKLRAAATTPVLWPSQVPVEADTTSDWLRQPCCRWPPSYTQ